VLKSQAKEVFQAIGKEAGLGPRAIGSGAETLLQKRVLCGGQKGCDTVQSGLVWISCDTPFEI
jgi:hypothetical protein